MNPAYAHLSVFFVTATVVALFLQVAEPSPNPASAALQTGVLELPGIACEPPDLGDRFRTLWVDLVLADGVDADNWTPKKVDAILEDAYGLRVLVNGPLRVADAAEAWGFFYDSAGPGVALILAPTLVRPEGIEGAWEGWGCGGVAIANPDYRCPEGLVVHEAGHVLGLGHGVGGVMGAACAHYHSDAGKSALDARWGWDAGLGPWWLRPSSLNASQPLP